MFIPCVLIFFPSINVILNGFLKFHVRICVKSNVKCKIAATPNSFYLAKSFYAVFFLVTSDERNGEHFKQPHFPFLTRLPVHKGIWRGRKPCFGDCFGACHGNSQVHCNNPKRSGNHQENVFGEYIKKLSPLPYFASNHPH